MNASAQTQLKILWLITISLVVLVIYLLRENSENSGGIIHANGIVIEDEAGEPRILIGNPIPDKTSRLRKDTLNGIVLLDDKGVDRVHLGEHGKLYLGGQLEERLNDGYSLFFNDSLGEERSGYGFSDDDNSVGLGMDYGGADGGEAIYLYAAPGIAFMTMNADLPPNSGIRDRIVLWHESDNDLSLMKLSDSSGDGKVMLRTTNGEVDLQWRDSTGTFRSIK